MSTLIVKVSKVENIEPHPNADKLEAISILGYDTVVPKGEFKIGDKVVFIPYDTVLTKESAQKLGVEKYLKGKNHDRVGHVNLRGKRSYGVVTKPLDPNWPVGKDVAKEYGATKYIPPVKFNCKSADVDKDDPRFRKYTDIENVKNFPDIILDNEMVVITEKLHGTSSRVAMISGKIKCGSRNLQRKPPGIDHDGYNHKLWFWQKWLRKLKHLIFGDKINLEKCKTNWWWFPYSLESVRNLLNTEGKDKNIAIYGETYGEGVQFLHYGVKKTKENPTGLAFAAFDIVINDKFVDRTVFVELCNKYGVPTAPLLYEGPFDKQLLKHYSTGPSVLYPLDIREGCVVKPSKERHDNRFGRVILKCINDDYLDKLKEDYTDV